MLKNFLHDWIPILSSLYYCLSIGEILAAKNANDTLALGLSTPPFRVVSGVQESVLVDFISQNKVKICQNCLYQKYPYKNEQIYIF